MRKTYYLLFVLLVFGLQPEKSFGYSYAEAEDPLVILFKDAVSAANNGNWKLVSDKAKEGIIIQNNHRYKAGFLEPKFLKSISLKDVSGTAEVFANLVYLSICEKLEQNKIENFKSHKTIKFRLALARKSYLDVLDGNVKKHEAGRSKVILDQFNTALSNIGNPGLFGIGKKAPDPIAYEKSVKEIKTLITKSFPNFSLN